MEYKCSSCEVTFKIEFTSEAKDSYADAYYCPLCGKETLSEND